MLVLQLTKAAVSYSGVFSPRMNPTCTLHILLIDQRLLELPIKTLLHVGLRQIRHEFCGRDAVCEALSHARAQSASRRRNLELYKNSIGVATFLNHSQTRLGVSIIGARLYTCKSAIFFPDETRACR